MAGPPSKPCLLLAKSGYGNIAEVVNNEENIQCSRMTRVYVFLLFFSSSSFLPPVPSRILGIFIRVYVDHARIARPAWMLMQLNTSLGKFAGRKAYTSTLFWGRRAMGAPSRVLATRPGFPDKCRKD